MAKRNWERWHQWAGEATETDLPLVCRLAGDAAAAALVEAIFGNSPFLSHALLTEPAFLGLVLEEGPDAAFARVLRDIDAGIGDVPALMRALRIAKRRTALLAGIADVSGAWGLEQVTSCLTELADTALRRGAVLLLRLAHEAGEIVLPDPARPERESGLIIIGMGKLGARELNYSSDIDFIVFYDAEKVDYRGRRSMPEMFAKMTRDLAGILEERTTDGYVFRADLRLRPDPASTPPAISVQAAETYYEGVGQNWERAALIKARQVAGDRTAGAMFLKSLNPFVWRKHLDFAAIQDIHSIKRQINAHKGGGAIAISGHNIKLGRGGIREIEFFAQTQQLIWGGREPKLRAAGTLEALDALVEAGHVDTGARDELTGAYRFLRRVEHRLQMIDDRQTQTLPDDPAKLEALAVFLGFPDKDGFATALHEQLKTVERHYAGLFEDAPPLSGPGNLVFTGTENDPDTLETLSGMGFANALAVSEQIRGWHHGRARATRSARARELLTELTPSLLQALAAGAEPDAAFLRFARFLDGLPAGVPLFSLFVANPGLLDFLAEIMGAAPRLADALSAKPGLFDGVLSRDFLDPLPPLAMLSAELDDALAPAREDYQELLDTARRWGNEQKFRVGVQTLRGIVSPEQAAARLTDIAEASLGAAQGFVEDEFARLHGRFDGPGAAIIAMGKMGSREMTATSDLDLILVYETPPSQEQSDGTKPLAPSVYFSRLTQRIINALTAKTPEGYLYEVDMRLRPSGNSGPIAVSLEAFSRYHQSMAWTWEHLALTRARVVTGDPALRARVGAIIRRTLLGHRDPGRLVTDTADMRARIFRQHGTDNPWEVKHRVGGLIDIEFIVQYLQLRHAEDHPGILDTGTRPALEKARNCGLLSEADAEDLEEAFTLWSAVQQVLRQTLGGSFDEKSAPVQLRRLLATTAGLPNFEMLRTLMEERAHKVRSIFARLIEEPARAVSPGEASRKENEP